MTYRNQKHNIKLVLGPPLAGTDSLLGSRKIGNSSIWKRSNKFKVDEDLAVANANSTMQVNSETINHRTSLKN